MKNINLLHIPHSNCFPNFDAPTLLLFMLKLHEWNQSIWINNFHVLQHFSHVLLKLSSDLDPLWNSHMESSSCSSADLQTKQNKPKTKTKQNKSPSQILSAMKIQSSSPKPRFQSHLLQLREVKLVKLVLKSLELVIARRTPIYPQAMPWL